MALLTPTNLTPGLYAFRSECDAFRSTGSTASWISSESNYAGASLMSEGSMASFVVEVKFFFDYTLVEKKCGAFSETYISTTEPTAPYFKFLKKRYFLPLWGTLAVRVTVPLVLL